MLRDKAARDPDAFWGELASAFHWERRWDAVSQGEMPATRWYVGGKTNLSFNCLDRHLEGSRRTKAALIWEGEPGDTRTLTYQELHREVTRFAGALRTLGVGPGDRVGIYLPVIPEAAIAMLACTASARALGGLRGTPRRRSAIG